MENIKYVERVVQSILEGGVVKATKFVSPRLIVRATRTKNSFGKRENIEMTLTIGRPNFAEREYIKESIKAKEKFPLEGVVIKIYNPKRKIAKKKV